MAALPAHSRCLAHSGCLPVISFPFEPLRVTGGGGGHSFILLKGLGPVERGAEPELSLLGALNAL